MTDYVLQEALLTEFVCTNEHTRLHKLCDAKSMTSMYDTTKRKYCPQTGERIFISIFFFCAVAGPCLRF